MYGYFSFGFSAVPKKVELLKDIESDVATFKIVPTIQK